MLVLFLLFGGYMMYQQKKIFCDAKLMTIVVILIVLMPWLQLVCNMLNVHITPMLFAVMLIAELVDHRMGIAAAVLLAAESALFAADGAIHSCPDDLGLEHFCQGGDSSGENAEQKESLGTLEKLPQQGKLILSERIGICFHFRSPFQFLCVAAAVRSPGSYA